MRKALSVSIILTVLAIIAYFTKPSEEACIDKAKDEFEAKKLSYTTSTLPQGVNPDVFKETAEKNFLSSLHVVDRFLFREIVQASASGNKQIGWAAFGWINASP